MSLIFTALTGVASLGAGLRLAATYGVLPIGLSCGCSALPQRHEIAPIMLVTGVAYVGLTFMLLWGGALPLSDAIGATVYVLLGGWCLRDWWIHTRNKRRRLKDRVLGVVRATAVGLKIVLVPAGARA